MSRSLRRLQCMKAQRHLNGIHDNNVWMKHVRKTVAAHPSYVVEVTEYPVDKTAQALVDSLTSTDENVQQSILRVDRSALVKFKRHADVLPGMKALERTAILGAVPKVEHYLPWRQDGDTAYDTADATDEFHELLVADATQGMANANPSLRYQFLRNQFERDLHDASVRQDVSFLVDASAPEPLRKEVHALLKESPRTTATTERLLQIYMQRADLHQLTSGFEELSKIFGAPDAQDPHNWSEAIPPTSNIDVQRINERLRLLDQEALANPEVALGLKPAPVDSIFHKKQLNALLNHDVPLEVKSSVKTNDEETEDLVADGEEEEALKAANRWDRKEFAVTTDDGATENISLEDPLMLRGKDGNCWSGVVLDNDTTQKTMPGGRVMTHRCLVVVGNLRGTAGFGKGKGQNPDDALNAAFRYVTCALVSKGVW